MTPENVKARWAEVTAIANASAANGVPVLMPQFIESVDAALEDDVFLSTLASNLEAKAAGGEVDAPEWKTILAEDKSRPGDQLSKLWTLCDSFAELSGWLLTAKALFAPDTVSESVDAEAENAEAEKQESGQQD